MREAPVMKPEEACTANVQRASRRCQYRAAERESRSLRCFQLHHPCTQRRSMREHTRPLMALAMLASTVAMAAGAALHAKMGTTFAALHMEPSMHPGVQSAIHTHSVPEALYTLFPVLRRRYDSGWTQ